MGFSFPFAPPRGSCLGIEPNICPPHQPDKNPFVERFHRTLGHECLQLSRPGTLQEVREVTEAFLQHYNWERPLKAADVWQCAPARSLSHLTRLACPRRRGLILMSGSRHLIIRDSCAASVGTAVSTWICRPIISALTWLGARSSWPRGSLRTALCGLACGSGSGRLAHQRADEAGDGHRRLPNPYETRSAGTCATFNSSYALESASAPSLVAEWRSSQAKR